MAKKMIIHARGLMKVTGPDTVINQSPITVDRSSVNLLNNYVIVNYDGKVWYIPWQGIDLIEEING